MRERETTLDRELEPFLPGLVCLTGGGGKTTLLFALAERMAARGERPLCATTTRMALPRENAWLSVVIGVAPGDLALPASGALFAALPPADGPDARSGKVRGYPADLLDQRFLDHPSERILVEADGARRLPLKAPGDREPVLPRLTTAVVAVVGLRCLGESLSDAIAFRPERVAAATGLRPGDAVTPAAVARLAAHPDGLFKSAPAAAAWFLFCNQSDLPGAEEGGRAVAAALAGQSPGVLHGVYLGSLLTKGLSCLSFPTR